MKAPDITKADAIYIGEENVAYIRKSALLEWAKERYQQTISNVGCYTGHSVWAEVIDKLNNF